MTKKTFRNFKITVNGFNLVRTNFGRFGIFGLLVGTNFGRFDQRLITLYGERKFKLGLILVAESKRPKRPN